MIVITIGELSIGKKMKCPPATQDLELNTKNRDAAIHADHIQYGPLNVDEPGDYWKDIAEYWDTTENAAKKSLCGNCVAFDISPRMYDCMPGQTSDEDGRLGYCWMHHFKCHSARSCRTWAKGGPIEEDKISYDWQERNEATDVIEEAKYKGRKVQLNKRLPGDVKKFKAFVKGCGKDKDRVTKINFGSKEMKIKKNIPARRKSFRARHKCHTAKDKCTARYWSCKAW